MAFSSTFQYSTGNLTALIIDITAQRKNSATQLDSSPVLITFLHPIKSEVGFN